MTLPVSLVLAALRPAGSADLPALAAPDLARRLGAGSLLLPPQDRPDACLARLSAAGATGTAVLAALPCDPGLPLEGGGSWAQALGAWRQPVLLLVPADQLATGLPAAAVALFERWGVPLVGLLQWDGPWSDSQRRSDGLPWLGCADDLEDEELQLLVGRRLLALERLPAAAQGAGQSGGRASAES